MYESRYDSRSSGWTGLSRFMEGPAAWILVLIVIPILLVAVLLLPPVNLLDRLQAFTYTRIDATAGGAVSDPDGTMVIFPAEGLDSSVLANIESTPRAEFIEGQGGRALYEAARNLPDYLIPKSPYYDLTVSGSDANLVLLDIPIPNDSLPYETLGIYGWDGTSWQHLPGAVLVTEDRLESELDSIPNSFMVMQTVSEVPSATANLGLDAQLPQGAVVTNDAKAGLYLRGDGALEGVAPVNTGFTLPIMRNWEGNVVRTDLINNMLIDPGRMDNQIAAVQQTVVQNDYPGAIIDYRGVDAVPSARADFVLLISRLAEELHAAGKSLTVRVEPARQVSADSWDTGGYDWEALSAVVDTLIVPTSVDPRAYQPNGEVEALMTWATSQVERRKLQIELPSQSIERAGNYLLLKGYQEALAPLVANIEVDPAENSPEVMVALDNPRLMSQVIWDDAIGMYYYDYMDDQGFQRTVYIEDAGSISRKLEQMKDFNVGDVSMMVPASGDIDPNIWNVLNQFQQGVDLSANLSQLAVVYSVAETTGSVLAQDVRPIDNATMVFTPPPGTDEVQVDAQVIGSNGQPVAIARTKVASVSSTGVAAAPASTSAPAAEGTQTVSAPSGPAVSSGQIVNVREGPSTVYPVLGQINPGDSYPVTAKNDAGDWWQIDVNGSQAWIIGQLVNTSGDVNSVAIATDIPAPPEVVVAAAPAPAEAGQPAPAAAPPIVSAPPPSGGMPFGYGVQAHMVHNEQAGQVMASTTGMGFNWVKQQIEWKVFEPSPGDFQWGASDGIVNAANGAGVNLLFSTVNAPPWAREPGFDGGVGGPPQDPQTFANFLGALAGKYCGSSLKAIEVWNEQNLHYEWGNKPLNANEYVALLAPSYAAIKAACPSMWVVSGALTPAGSNPPYAMDDFQYFEEMMKAGMANYADGFGVHPSGYNVPPSSTWETACDAIIANGNSFNGACDSPHHSWSFRSTMEGYRNIANVYGASDKTIVPTEFGWAAGGALDPRYKYADDNDFNEQAQWTVEAYQMMKAWGWVGPAILWNLNFRVVANGTEKAQWGIVDPGWGPLPIYNALASMPK